MKKIYTSTIGLEITLRVQKDISGATVLRILYQKPSGTSGYWTATAKTSRSIAYITAAGNLNEAGIWQLQAYIETPTQQLSGKIAKIAVEQRL